MSSAMLNSSPYPQNRAAAPPPPQPNSNLQSSQIGHFLNFQVSTNRITSQHRAVNITPVRTKQVARIESTKGEYGFISFKVDEKDHHASLTKNGAHALPQNTGNLFFHSSELVGVAMYELQVGDVVEFNVVHNKRTNKYCAAKVRFIERKPEILSASNEQIEEAQLEATDMTSLPGVRQMLRSEAQRAPFMRKISQSDVNGAATVATTTGASPKNVPQSPTPRASVSSNGDLNNNKQAAQQAVAMPSTPTEDTRPERMQRFKKSSINVGESLLRGENQATRQPTTGNTEIKGFGLQRQHSKNDNCQSVIDIDNTSSSGDNRNSSVE